MVSLKSMNFKYCPLSQGAKLLILIIFAITFTICAFNIESIFNMFFEVFGMFSIYVVYFSTGSPVLTMLTLIIPFFFAFWCCACDHIEYFFRYAKTYRNFGFL